jgi:hypothetical protein
MNEGPKAETNRTKTLLKSELSISHVIRCRLRSTEYNVLKCNSVLCSHSVLGPSGQERCIFEKKEGELCTAGNLFAACFSSLGAYNACF